MENTNIVDITPIVQAVIALILAVVGTFLVPWINAKVSEIKINISDRQWQMLQEWTVKAVKAAEVLFKGTKLGKDKLAYVTQYLNEMCKSHGFTFNEKVIRQSIENAWKDMTDSEKTQKDKVA